MKYLFIFFLLIYLHSCSDTKPSLKDIDSLIVQHKYQQALQLTQSELKKDFSDTLDYKRLKKRIKTIERKQFFASIEQEIEQDNWQIANTNWKKVYFTFNNSSKSLQKKYGFDLYYLKSSIDSALSDSSAFWQSVKRSLEFNTANHLLQRQRYEKLGIHLASRDSLKEARECFDRSIRKVRSHQLNPALLKVYSAYMEGNFNNCRDELNAIPDSLQNNHWRRLQKFLNLYAAKLTSEERFKLW